MEKHVSRRAREKDQSGRLMRSELVAQGYDVGIALLARIRPRATVSHSHGTLRRWTDTTRTRNSEMLKLGLPKPYTARVRNALSASAESVNLRNLGGGGGAFYAGGSRLESVYV